MDNRRNNLITLIFLRSALHSSKPQLKIEKTITQSIFFKKAKSFYLRLSSLLALGYLTNNPHPKEMVNRECKFFFENSKKACECKMFNKLETS